MSNSKNDKPALKGVPKADIRTGKRRISIVWLVPLIALAIGGWLVYKAVSEKGPVITISFKSADGLEAGKTKIKYKDVELGRVVSIELDDDLSQVIVKAEMVKQALELVPLEEIQAGLLARYRGVDATGQPDHGAGRQVLLDGGGLSRWTPAAGPAPAH